MGARIDHLMWGAADLDAAMADAEARLGVAAVAGGSHPGRGTRNALLGLGPDCYLEIIAPDPAQNVGEGFAALLAGLAEPALVTFAVTSDDLPGLARRWRSAGYQARGPVTTRRTPPGGDELVWDLLFPAGHPFGSLCPFFIDWGSSRHPSVGLPAAGTLDELVLESPHAARLRELLADVAGPIKLVEAARPVLRARLAGPAGAVVLQSTPQTTGLEFG